MQNFSIICILGIAILFLDGCHHNAHIRTQRPLNPSEKVFSGSLTSFPIALVNKVDNWGNNPDASMGILGMRTELCLLIGMENYQELGAYAGLGLGSWAKGELYGLHYKKYQYIPLIDRLVKIGGGLEINISERGKVFNSKTSITETSSKKYTSYSGIHFLFAQSHENISYSYKRSQSYTDEGYNIRSIGVGITTGMENNSFIKNASSQIQFDVSLVYDRYNYGAEAVYFLFSYSMGLNLFLPSSAPKKSFTPLPPIQKKKTKPFSDKLSNNSNEFFDPETGKPVKKNSIIFDPKTGEVIEYNVEYDPETGEIIEDNIEYDPETNEDIE